MEKETKGSISIATVVFIVFLILKLTSVINWSWWWVFSPIWIVIGIKIVLLAALGLAIIIAKKKGISDEKIISSLDVK